MHRRNEMRSGSRVLRRVTAAVLSAALVVPTALSFPAQSYAAIESGDTAAVKEMAYHVYNTPDVVYYSDDFFRGDSMQYNSSLAALSFFVCNSTYQTRRSTLETQSRNLRELLTDNGFTDFEVNDDYKGEASLESSAVACARKSITDRGKTYTLLAVIPRSGTFGKEFERSLILSNSGSDKGDHAGYDACKDKVVAFVRKYIQDHGIKGDLKVWTTGYSGGGGVCNLFAAELLRYPAYVVCNPTFKPADLYCYNFSPMRAASVYSDPKNDMYANIHNVFDGADILSILPTSDEFDRYGTDYGIRDRESEDYEEVKARVLDLMKKDYAWIYEAYVREEDPDDFMPMKPDTEALKSGELVMVPDPDSYIPRDQAVYMSALEDTIKRVCAQEGDGDSRKGFYNVYQQPMMDLVGFFFEDGINYRNIEIMINAMTGTKKSMSLVLCMYTTFLVDKSISGNSAELNKLIEESFNRLASEMEDEDGSIRNEYKRFTAYEYIRDTYFTKGGDDSEKAYRLNISLSGSERSILLKYLKKLTGVLYADCMKEALTAAGKDEETIKKLTSEESREPVAWFLASLIFGNSLQSSKIEPLKFDNEQFCQMATFLGNFSRYASMHMYMSVYSWYREASPYYADFSKGTEAQNTGYRRVLISQPEGVSVSGTVTDSGGRQIASFTESGITSRNDEWTGMTTSDSGNWLRLQIDRPCKVNIQFSKDAAVSLEVDDYSITDGSVKRAVTGDDSGSWKGLDAKRGETLTIDMPAAEYRDGKYDLTSAVYTLSRKEKGSSAGSNDTAGKTAPATKNSTAGSAAAKTTTVYSKTVPAADSVKAKSGRRNFTVSWKKLPAKKLKKISGIQLQYSKYRNFKNAKTVTLKKTRRSYRLKGLKKGSTYYIRVRNVRSSGSTAYVSSWSKKMKVTVK